MEGRFHGFGVPFSKNENTEKHEFSEFSSFGPSVSKFQGSGIRVLDGVWKGVNRKYPIYKGVLKGLGSWFWMVGRSVFEVFKGEGLKSMVLGFFRFCAHLLQSNSRCPTLSCVH